MARLRQRKDRGGKWLLDYTDVDGKRYQVDTGTADETTANLWLAKYQERHSLAKIGQIERIGKITAEDLDKRKKATKQKQESRLRLSAFRDLYLDRAEHEFELAKSTRVIFKSATNLFISIIGDKLLRTISAEDVRKFKRKVRDQDKSRTTESMYGRSLSTAFNRAIIWGYLDQNPFSGVTMPSFRQTRRAEKDMTIQEVRILLATIDASENVQYGDYVRCVSYTGCRRNEILFLRGEDVDLEKRTLTVTVTKRKGGPVRLSLPINNSLYRVLSKMEIVPGQFVFRTDSNSRGAKRKGKAWHPSYVTHQFKKMITKAGLPEHYSLHSLRHTYVTYLREKGVPIDVIQRLVGHTSSRMTWDTYDHTEALSFRQYAEMVRFEDEEETPQ